MGKGCLACGRFFHNECLDTRDSVCCCKRSVAEATTAAILLNPYSGVVARAAENLSAKASDESRSGSGSVGSEGDSEESAVDILNRAVLEFPIDGSVACDWKSLADCGGGKYPIVGCANGYQLNLHHGPVQILPGLMDDDGRTYDFNSTGNIHKICGRCHLLWHYWNQETYDPIEALHQPHRPRPATAHELVTWSTGVSRPNAPEPFTGTFRKDSD